MQKPCNLSNEQSENPAEIEQLSDTLDFLVNYMRKRDSEQFFLWEFKKDLDRLQQPSEPEQKDLVDRFVDGELSCEDFIHLMSERHLGEQGPSKPKKPKKIGSLSDILSEIWHWISRGFGVLGNSKRANTLTASSW